MTPFCPKCKKITDVAGSDYRCRSCKIDIDGLGIEIKQKSQVMSKQVVVNKPKTSKNKSKR